MDSFYSGDHIAGDHIQMSIILNKIEETQQKYRLERSILDFWRGGRVGEGEKESYRPKHFIFLNEGYKT